MRAPSFTVPVGVGEVFSSAKGLTRPLSTFSGLLAAVLNLTDMAGENLTVGSGSWLPAASVAPGR